MHASAAVSSQNSSICSFIQKHPVAVTLIAIGIIAALVGSLGFAKVGALSQLGWEVNTGLVAGGFVLFVIGMTASLQRKPVSSITEGVKPEQLDQFREDLLSEVRDFLKEKGVKADQVACEQCKVSSWQQSESLNIVLNITLSERQNVKIYLRPSLNEYARGGFANPEYRPVEVTPQDLLPKIKLAILYQVKTGKDFGEYMPNLHSALLDRTTNSWKLTNKDPQPAFDARWREFILPNLQRFASEMGIGLQIEPRIETTHEAFMSYETGKYTIKFEAVVNGKPIQCEYVLETYGSDNDAAFKKNPTDVLEFLLERIADVI